MPSLSSTEPAELSHAQRALDALAPLRRAVTETKGWRRHALALAAGAASVLALAPFFLWPILFATLPVLVWLIDGTMRAPSAREACMSAAASGWWFGFGYFLAGLFWIGEAFLVEKEKFAWALPFAVTMLPAGLALFWGVAAAGARFFWRPGASRLFVLAIALASAEWLRGIILTGFPWNTLGYALTPPTVLMQAAALLGIDAMTLWTVVIFTSPLVLAADGGDHRCRRRGLAAGLSIAAIPLALLALYGALRLSQAETTAVDGVRVRVVQPSVPQREKWLPQNQGQIFRDHLALSRHDAQGNRDDLKGITHLVWPEAAMPFLPLEHPEAISEIANLLPDGTFLLSGALRREAKQDDGGQPVRAYNSLMVFDSDGALVQVYDKTHLVPFGEYLPFQEMLEAMGFEQLTRLRGGFSAGPSPRPLLNAGALPPAGGLICYEAIFPREIIQGSERPGLLVNVTNDGWFGNTSGPRQHFHQARVRAVETGLPLIRAANNGISAVVDPYGRVLGSKGLNERGVIDAEVPARGAETVYGRLGDWMFIGNALAFLALAVFARRRLI